MHLHFSLLGIELRTNVQEIMDEIVQGKRTNTPEDNHVWRYRGALKLIHPTIWSVLGPWNLLGTSSDLMEPPWSLLCVSMEPLGVL